MSPGDNTNVTMEDLGQGKFAVRSDLTFTTVTAVLADGKGLFAPHTQITVDMADVRKADSAGLALLLEWLSWARSVDRVLAYENVPPQILAIAQISEVTELLGGAEHDLGG